LDLNAVSEYIFYYIAVEGYAIKVSKVHALRHQATFMLQIIIICLCIYLAPLLNDQKSQWRIRRLGKEEQEEY